MEYSIESTHWTKRQLFASRYPIALSQRQSNGKFTVLFRNGRVVYDVEPALLGFVLLDNTTEVLFIKNLPETAGSCIVELDDTEATRIVVDCKRISKLT